MDKLANSPGGTVNKNPPANAGDVALIPSLGRSQSNYCGACGQQVRALGGA